MTRLPGQTRFKLRTAGHMSLSPEINSAVLLQAVVQVEAIHVGLHPVHRYLRFSQELSCSGVVG